MKEDWLKTEVQPRLRVNLVEELAAIQDKDRYSERSGAAEEASLRREVVYLPQYSEVLEARLRR
jgi:hypothetical protein